MGLALDLARSGYSAPNPHVGCVIVAAENVVGQGGSEAPGGAHAEIVALREAGAQARGADVYVTLEPCNHQGRTGPCSHALVAAGARRVYVGCPDPHPDAQGGADYLRSHGVEVVVGVREAECRHQHRAFLFAATHDLAYVTAKIAETADGFSAREDGTSKWITNEDARADGHRIRAEMGAVLVGRGTIEHDDPLLTSRIAGVTAQPQRYVLDPYRRLASHYRVFVGSDPARRVVALEHAQPGDLAVPWAEDGLDLLAVVRELRAEGHIGVLVEGGSNTVSHFIERGLADEVVIYRASDVEFGSGLPSLSERARKALNTYQSGIPQTFGTTTRLSFFRQA